LVSDAAEANPNNEARNSKKYRLALISLSFRSADQPVL